MASTVDIPSLVTCSEEEIGAQETRQLREQHSSPPPTEAQLPILGQKSVEGKALEFLNLTYEVLASKDINGKTVKARTMLLTNVTGAAYTRELMAVMGPSGSGKTTFMDALAGRIESSSLQGELTFSGERVNFDDFKRLSAYVQQDDRLFATLTVYETLLFSASVRLPPSVSAADKRARVDELLEQLGLERTRNTIVGSADVRGVSGGERRRVSIGVDIIHDPPVVFLDEPTSGLDSSSAFYVMEKLQSIAQTGSLVMCTIHQPSFRILELLDKLLILSRGQVAFLGPPATLPSYLVAAGFEVPEHANSAEVIMDLVEDRGQDDSSSTSQRLVAFSSQWQASQAAEEKAKPQGVPRIASFASALSTNPALAHRNKFVNNFFVEFMWLTWRAFLNIWRAPPLFIVRVVNMVMTGLVLGSVFFKPRKDEQGARHIIAFVTFVICAIFFTSNDALPAFILERRIFAREASHFTYRASSYVVANMIVFVPFLAILSLILTIIVFWMLSLSGGAGGFFFFFFVVLISLFLANSFVTFLSAVVPDLIIGNTVSLATTAYMLLFGGFFISRTEIPDYWIWFHYLSSIKYSYEALLIEEFDRPGSCYAQKTAGQCTLTGPSFLKSLGVGQLNKWECCAIILALGLAYRILFYFVLVSTAKSKRK